MSRFFNGFDSNVFLAPMAGITDKPMRRLVSSMGPGTMVSEMVAINAISRKNPKSYRIADVRDEPYKVVVQLVGGDEKLFADSVRLAEELGAYSVDINMGCPVKRHTPSLQNNRKCCQGHAVESQRQVSQRLGQQFG